MLWHYVYNILLWLDEGLNVILVGLLCFIFKLPPAAGEAHFTVSQVLAILREKGYKTGCIGCAILTAVWGLWIKKRPYDHCYDAMHDSAGNKLPESEDVG